MVIVCIDLIPDTINPTCIQKRSCSQLLTLYGCDADIEIHCGMPGKVKEYCKVSCANCGVYF